MRCAKKKKIEANIYMVQEEDQNLFLLELEQSKSRIYREVHCRNKCLKSSVVRAEGHHAYALSSLLRTAHRQGGIWISVNIRRTVSLQDLWQGMKIHSWKNTISAFT